MCLACRTCACITGGLEFGDLVIPQYLILCLDLSRYLYFTHVHKVLGLWRYLDLSVYMLATSRSCSHSTLDKPTEAHLDFSRRYPYIGWSYQSHSCWHLRGRQQRKSKESSNSQSIARQVSAAHGTCLPPSLQHSLLLLSQ